MFKCKRCQTDKNPEDFRKSDRYKRGYTATCKQCDSEKNKIRRRKKKLDEIASLDDYLAIKVTNMRRMDVRHNREVINRPEIADLKKVIETHDNKCVYTGTSLIWHPSATVYERGSFDRIDNNLGHEVGNLQITSIAANLMRGSMTHSQFKKHISELDCVSSDDDMLVVN